MKIIVLPVALIASLLSNLSISTHNTVRNVHLPLTLAIPAAAQDMAFVPTQKTQIKALGLRFYSYEFKGQAKCEGMPCVDAQITLSVISNHGSQLLKARTDKNGRFTALVKVDSKRNGIVRWEMTGLSKEFQKGITEGHQIPQEETQVTLDVSLNLASR
jgi:hypothetical protein